MIKFVLAALLVGIVVSATAGAPKPKPAAPAAPKPKPFGFGGGGFGGGGGGGKKGKKGEFTSNAKVTVGGVKFSNPTWKKFKVGSKKVKVFAVKKNGKQYYYPMHGEHSGMWLTYKTKKNKRTGKTKKYLAVDQQQFRVWYRKTCKINGFTGDVTCKYCFKINYLAGVLDYGATKSVKVNNFVFTPGQYSPSLALTKGRGGGGGQRYPIAVMAIKAGGETYQIPYATSGKYQGKFIIPRRGKIRVIKNFKVDVYQRKYCAKSIRGYRCRYCFIITPTPKKAFLPGPNIFLGATDSGKVYINSPQHKKISMGRHGGSAQAVRVILSMGRYMIFYYYIISGKMSGRWTYYNSRQKRWRIAPLKVLMYTKYQCKTAGVKNSCGFAFKIYKHSKAPKAAAGFKYGNTSMKSPQVGRVKVYGWKGGNPKVVLWHGTYQGTEFPLYYAMEGNYAGQWFYVNKHRRKTIIFKPMSAKALYNWKYCKQNFKGTTVCRYCFMMVPANEKKSALPKGKALTVSKATFHSPKNINKGKGHYTRFFYSKGKVNKALMLRRNGKTAAAGKWFAFTKKGKMVPTDVPYDMYFHKSCTKFGKRTECRHCFMIQNRPKLAIQPIRPAKKVTINGVQLSVYNGKKGHYKMYKLKLGRKNTTKAHIFKACKGGQCTAFFYATSGKDVGKWYKKGGQGWAQTKLINKTMWTHYHCQDGLTKTICQWCFAF